MTATISEIRDAVQSTLSGLDLVPYDVATGAERLGRAVALVFPRAGGRRMATCDKWSLPFTIEIHVPMAAGLTKAQDKLDAFIDPTASTSVMNALNNSRTLGGVVDDSECGAAEAYSFAVLNGAETLAARLVLTVFV